MNRREEILAAGFEILGKDGLEGLHARTVAAVVGVNHAAVHYYFPRRQDLLLGVLEFAQQHAASERKRSSKSGKGLAAEFAYFESKCKPSSKFFRIWTSFLLAAQFDAAIKTKLNEVWTDWAAELNSTQKSKKSKKAGSFSDPYFLLATIFGIGIVSQSTGGKLNASKSLESLLKEAK